MDSGLAAVLGAGIGFFGSLVGTVIVPAVGRRGDLKRARENARLDALRRIIPGLVGSSLLLRTQYTSEHGDRALQLLAELEVWLTEDEWPIGRLATLAVLPTKDSKVDDKTEGHLLLPTLLPAWMRGEITAERAREIFEDRTGRTLYRVFTP